VENLLSYSFHGYQSELFPTRTRTCAIGFVYSWRRLSAALFSLVVAFLLHLGGVNAVFGFIAFAMAVVLITIGGFGSRTRGLALEAIAHETSCLLHLLILDPMACKARKLIERMFCRLKNWRRIPADTTRSLPVSPQLSPSLPARQTACGQAAATSPGNVN
jgi:hypothetical protein